MNFAKVSSTNEPIQNGESFLAKRQSSEIYAKSGHTGWHLNPSLFKVWLKVGQPDVNVLLRVDDDCVMGADMGHAPHSVHGLDGVEPTLPASPCQVLPDPGCLQVLESVEVWGSQPRMLQTLGSCVSMFGADNQKLLDQVDGFLWDCAEGFLLEASVDKFTAKNVALGSGVQDYIRFR